MRKIDLKSPWIVRAVLLFVTPIIVYVLSEVLLSDYSVYIAVLLGIATVATAFIKYASEKAQFMKALILISFAMSLVFAYEDGYFSRFWFLLYLAAIYLGFLYTPKEAFAFLAGVMIAFIPSVGEVDVAFDIMSYVSLLLVVPLVIFLRDRYLVIKQSNK